MASRVIEAGVSEDLHWLVSAIEVTTGFSYGSPDGTFSRPDQMRLQPI
ncbi:hypothetical protein [Acetobacter fallax]|uniref:Uncharacterized protein n=1 Tax=Acetobacter fallax TaxID=1737473 RepID=A0ABX0K6V9_9PROT|nr:hypothetical protein [Acetobacter fallax]NHO31199.1 hypothetical protein [Acetobacter fallax]NHO34756.1 hypothetical protein [Acetobacter fallax]